MELNRKLILVQKKKLDVHAYVFSYYAFSMNFLNISPKSCLCDIVW